MTAVRDQIFVEIERRLAALGNVAEVERMPSADPISFPALHLYDNGQQQDDSDATSTRYTLGLTIEGYVEGGSGAEAHATLHALYTETVRALITEPPLDGLAETIDEGGMRVDVAELASEARLGFALDFIITYPTARGRPDEPA